MIILTWCFSWVLWHVWFISEDEAKKKIYNVSCERYFGFGCEIDEETSNKLEGLYFSLSPLLYILKFLRQCYFGFISWTGLPGVLFVLPDSYVDAENKDYGGRLNLHSTLLVILFVDLLHISAILICFLLNYYELATSIFF